MSIKSWVLQFLVFMRGEVVSLLLSYSTVSLRSSSSRMVVTYTYTPGTGVSDGSNAGLGFEAAELCDTADLAD